MRKEPSKMEHSYSEKCCFLLFFCFCFCCFFLLFYTFYIEFFVIVFKDQEKLLSKNCYSEKYGFGSTKGYLKTPIGKRNNKPKPVVPKGFFLTQSHLLLFVALHFLWYLLKTYDPKKRQIFGNQ